MTTIYRTIWATKPDSTSLLKPSSVSEHYTTVLSGTVSSNDINNVYNTRNALSSIQNTPRLSSVALLSSNSAARLLTSLSTSTVRVSTTVSNTVDHTLSAKPNLAFSELSNVTKTGSARTIGLSIGLPIGIFCFSLLVFLIYFYFFKNPILSSNRPVSPDFFHKEKKEERIPLYNPFNQPKGGGPSHDEIKNEKFAAGQFGGLEKDACNYSIKYNISRPIKEHILTPKVALHPSSKELNDIDKYLYEQPPNIYRVDSKLPPLDHSREITNVGKHQKDASDDRWKYNSPLSKWFLRGSTYFKDKNISGLSLADSVTNLTPTLHLKQLNILRKNKEGYAAEANVLNVDETSPILTTKHPNYTDTLEKGSTPTEAHVSIVKSPIIERQRRVPSLIYGEVSPQFLDEFEDNNPVSLEHAPAKVHRKKKSTERFKQKLQEKKLPQLPATDEKPQLQIGHVYQVANDYAPHLTDEIWVQKGEFVRILVVHNDGWCLVEKCARDGTSKSVLDLMSSDGGSKNRKYLNDDRGIVPADCLAELDG
ncbi:Fus1p KNAG_0C00560 [Huiozyma naganishii CBS 8797]|uniref:SH3 domain-containing protein n=1 Tax=Huiozyma naganishii (strain ATCC MYA-139 / BCRC 22969 / CBS 8797 / KCTC 17520 / NBRC 10181 / NCYC 3082 / Yp74L-3) TaxID=1071383 RepID=J7R2W7_HUIN7|nr:hypothetical protein KNAG_0C00560 [Kazachstania naganishii CBS 8797]CCK69170.1 hypothetical protein KNAG_0C00560 [Kazachstania naganishii CBS 8797]